MELNKETKLNLVIGYFFISAFTNLSSLIVSSWSIHISQFFNLHEVC